jgi:uncharacterized repeat protein (TIGR04052 family)
MRPSPIAITITFAAAASVGCSSHNGHSDGHVDYTIDFVARVGSQALQCGQSYMVGSPATAATPADFRFYVSDVSFLKADGSSTLMELESDGVFQDGNVALLDFEDKSGGCAGEGTAEKNTQLKLHGPKGTYTGISFTVGVPFALNHKNTATASSPLNLTQMWWSWNAGYKFAKLDWQASAAGAPRFNIHIGSTGCQGDAADGGVVSACDRPNRMRVTLMGVTPGTSKIVVDAKMLLEASDLSVNAAGAPGCMSGPTDPECVTLMPKLGLDSAGMPMATQALFRVE